VEILILDRLYVGRRNGQLVGTTDPHELENANDTIIGYGSYAQVAYYCAKHDHIGFFAQGSDFHVDNARKARDCEEFRFFEKCWRVHRNFAKAILENDKKLISKAIKRLRKRHLERLLSDKELLRQLLERLDGPLRSELEALLVNAKLES